MNEYFLLYCYILYSYLYMGHKFVTQFKGNIPQECKDYPIAAALVGTVIFFLSPIMFIVHVVYQAYKTQQL